MAQPVAQPLRRWAGHLRVKVNQHNFGGCSLSERRAAGVGAALPEVELHLCAVRCCPRHSHNVSKVLSTEKEELAEN